jgi:hypothetical protein
MSNKYLPLAQANLRRWLDARVPLTAKDVKLSDKDHSTLCYLVRKWEIPVLIRKEGEDNYSFIIDEGKGEVDNMYVAAVNIRGDDLVGALYDMRVRFGQWRCISME